jgi:hypothetical protein
MCHIQTTRDHFVHGACDVQLTLPFYCVYPLRFSQHLPQAAKSNPHVP